MRFTEKKTTKIVAMARENSGDCKGPAIIYFDDELKQKITTARKMYESKPENVSTPTIIFESNACLIDWNDEEEKLFPNWEGMVYNENRYLFFEFDEDDDSNFDKYETINSYADLEISSPNHFRITFPLGDDEIIHYHTMEFEIDKLFDNTTELSNA